MRRKGRAMNQKCCTTCQYVDVNEMSDERYCALHDYESIRLRWHHYRPDWCPRLKGKNDGRVSGDRKDN